MTTPAEQAAIDAAAAEYAARQARPPVERQIMEQAAALINARFAAQAAGVPFDRYGWEHARWRERRATEATTLVAVRVGDLARSLLVDGRWHDGRWQLVANGPNTHDLSWVEASRRAVLAHSVVQGWQADDRTVAVANRWSRLQAYSIGEPAPDCPGADEVWQVQSEVTDSGEVTEDETTPAAYTASDEVWCPECEHTVPLIADRRPDVGDVLVTVEHDRKGRMLA